MTTTVANAVTMLRERLDESTAAQWSDVQLRRWLNEAIRDIARRTHLYTDTDTIAVTGGTGEYTVAADVLRINSVYFTPDGESRKMPVEARAWEAMDNVWWDAQDRESGWPAYYTTYGFAPVLKLKLFPIPSGDGDLTLHVARLPAALDVAAGTGNIEVIEGWLEPALDYAEYMAFRKDRDMEMAKSALQVYEARVNDMLETAETLNANGEIVAVGGRFLPAHIVYGGW